MATNPGSERGAQKALLPQGRANGKKVRSLPRKPDDSARSEPLYASATRNENFRTGRIAASALRKVLRQ
eukprot:6203693-Pleurochrysis_carterae.AAC.3